jgi:hypothetical protein
MKKEQAEYDKANKKSGSGSTISRPNIPRGNAQKPMKK